MGWNNVDVAQLFINHFLLELPPGHLRGARDWLIATQDGPTHLLLLIAHILLDFRDELSWEEIFERSLVAIDGQLRALADDPLFERPPEEAKADG
ncbi:MAG: hypothetical protein JO284_17775 [Planctomycetaceae bacterium]|nr:hypothetical protein [Planctomycetaceae bacterium]